MSVPGTPSETHRHPRPYGLIFMALFALTVAEIFYAQVKIPHHFVVIGLIVMAVIKAALVGMFYMHLKFEKILLTILLVGPLAFSLIFVFMIGWDIWYQ